MNVRRQLRALLCAACVAVPIALPAQGAERADPSDPPPEPLAALSRSAMALRDSLVSLARPQIGKRYRWGGESPRRGFDCSGLVRYIASALDIRLPRTAAQQARIGREVPADTAHLLPGDLLIFGSERRISHIGIYVGNGRFIHASTAAGRVVESDVLRPRAHGVKPWRGVRRLVTSDSITDPTLATELPSNGDG